MEWFLNNFGTIAVGLIVFVIAFFAFRSVRKDFNAGGCSSCGGNCSCCHNKHHVEY